MKQEIAFNHYGYGRFHDRKKYEVGIVFLHKKRLYAGCLKDVSLGGACIETNCVNQFSTKDIVTLIIPFTSGQNNVKRRGSIRWINNTDFGVGFI